MCQSILLSSAKHNHFVKLLIDLQIIKCRVVLCRVVLSLGLFYYKLIVFNKSCLNQIIQWKLDTWVYAKFMMPHLDCVFRIEKNTIVYEYIIFNFKAYPRELEDSMGVNSASNGYTHCQQNQWNMKSILTGWPAGWFSIDTHPLTHCLVLEEMYLIYHCTNLSY